MPRQTKADLQALLEEEEGKRHYAEHKNELLHDQIAELKEKLGQTELLHQKAEQKAITERKEGVVRKFEFTNTVLQVGKHLSDCAKTGVFEREGHDSFGVTASAVILGDFCADYGKLNYCGIFGHPWQAYNWCRTAVSDRGNPSSSYVIVTLMNSGELVVEPFIPNDGTLPKSQRMRFSS